MRFWIAIAAVPCACVALPASADTLRVGQQVLITGDSAARVVELLGQPVHKAHGAGQAKQSRAAKGKARTKQAADKAAEGERWQYRQGRRTITVVLVQGKVVRIE